MKPTATLAIATVFLLLPFSVHAQANDTPNTPDSQNVTSPTRGQREAKRMVPAQGTLIQNIDSKKDQVGQEFNVKLAKTAQLEDGTKLPTGTIIVGNIVDDDQQVNGQAKLAVRFTQAKLKDGSAIPIKATIVGVSSPENTDAQGNPVWAGDTPTAAWNGETGIDEIGVFSHVDMHSKVTSHNSGVFVSTDKDEVKVKAGSVIGLAITKTNAGTSQ